MYKYNLEAEMSVIGSLILDPPRIVECRAIKLSYEDFALSQNQIIYRCIEKILNANAKLDILTLSDELKLQNQFDQIGGAVYLVNTINTVPTSANIAYYANIVKNLSIKRRLQNDIAKMQSLITNIKIDDLIAYVDNLRDIILDSGSLENFLFLASQIPPIQEITGYVPTGFAQLDAICGNGLAFGTLTVLTGDPSSGKSTLVNQIVSHAIYSGHGSFIYSGELNSEMLMRWFYKTAANAEDLIKSSDYFGISSQVSEEGYEKIKQSITNKLYLFSNVAKADERNIAAVIEYLAVKKGVRLFVLDNLMTLEFSGQDKYEKQIRTVKLIKYLAKKYDLAIILIAHPNKTSMINRECHVFEIAGASEVPNLADYVFKIIRGEDGQAEIILMKNRITGIQRKRLKLNFSPFRKRFYTESLAELNRKYY